MKVCSKCGIEKEFTAFSKHKTGLYGLRPSCKVCIKKDYEDNKDAILYQKKQHYQENSSIIKQKRKEYYYSNPERSKQTNKNWCVRNKDKVYLNKKRYYQENKSEINQYKLKYSKKRCAEDPQFRVGKILRTRLSDALRGRNKSGSAVRDLGMPIPAFLTYLNLDCLDKYGIPYTGNEHLFHVDHIKPLSSFDLTDRNQLLIACNWSNLQVLTVKENLSKGARK